MIACKMSTRKIAVRLPLSTLSNIDLQKVVGRGFLLKRNRKPERLVEANKMSLLKNEIK